VGIIVTRKREYLQLSTNKAKIGKYVHFPLDCVLFLKWTVGREYID
jgi:hypothetical protein